MDEAKYENAVHQFLAAGTKFFSCENCSLADSEFTVLLVAQLPEEYYPDSASIIGGDVYHNGKGEFIVTIPDLNNVKTEEANWGKMWDTMAFDLAPVTVEPESD